jgi:protein SCO1/2
MAALTAPRLSQSRSAPITVSVNGAAPRAAELSAGSLFQLDAAWTNDNAESVRLSALRGSVAVLAMIFTRCPSACPTLVKELQALQRRLPAEARARTKFVLLSIDPEHDTPAALAEYRSKMGLDSQHWLLLRGSADDVRDVSASLGVSYGQGQGMAIAHSRLVSVLDSEGELVHQQPGVTSDPEKLASAIAQAAKRVD